MYWSHRTPEAIGSLRCCHAEFFMDPVGISMCHDLLKSLERLEMPKESSVAVKHAAMHQMFTQKKGTYIYIYIYIYPFSKVETCWNHQPDLMLNLDLKKWRIRKEDLGGNTSRRCHPARISAPGKLWQQWIGMEITSICQRSTVWCYSYPLVFKIALENMEIAWKYPMFIGKSSMLWIYTCDIFHSYVTHLRVYLPDSPMIVL